VRQFLIFVEHSIDEGTQSVVFEPNDSVDLLDVANKHIGETGKN